MQLRRVNRKQLFVEALNHKESIQEAVTEKAAQFITGLGVYMNPEAQINKPLAGAGLWSCLHHPCVPELLGEPWVSTDLSWGQPQLVQNTSHR